MHVELTEKELLSCGLPMYVCSLHEKECPCLLCSIAQVTVTWGCALQVTVSTSNSCCCPVQLFRVVVHWVAMCSWSLVRLNTSLERSFEPPLASMCSLDKENVFPRIDNAEITDFNFKRNNTLTCSAICRSLAPGLLPSGHDGRLVQTLISFSSGCQQFRLFLRKGGSGLVPVWCLPEQESLESDEPPSSLNCCHCSAVSLERWAAICIRCRCLTRLVFASVITSSSGNTKGKLFTKLKKSNGEHLFDLLHAAGQYRQRMRFQHLFRSRFARSLTPARWPARQSISECSAGKRPISCEQTTDTTVLYRLSLPFNWSITTASLP